MSIDINDNIYFGGTTTSTSAYSLPRREIKICCPVLEDLMLIKQTHNKHRTGLRKYRNKPLLVLPVSKILLHSSRKIRKIWVKK